MKKYHCVGPTFKLRKRSRGLTFKLWREVLWSLFQILEGPSVLPLNSEVIPGPWVPSSRVLVPFLLHSVHSSRSNLLKKIKFKFPTMACSFKNNQALFSHPPLIYVWFMSDSMADLCLLWFTMTLIYRNMQVTTVTIDCYDKAFECTLYNGKNVRT